MADRDRLKQIVSSIIGILENARRKSYHILAYSVTAHVLSRRLTTKRFVNGSKRDQLRKPEIAVHRANRYSRQSSVVVGRYCKQVVVHIASRCVDGLDAKFEDFKCNSRVGTITWDRDGHVRLRSLIDSRTHLRCGERRAQ